MRTRCIVRSATIAAVVILARATAALAAPPIPVTACGQIVQGTGTLVADLDCSLVADDAVKLSGRLLLAGFTLTGHPAHDVVRCQVGQCRVVGPGTITGGTDGVRSDRTAKIEAGVVISGNGGDGVRTDRSAKVSDSTITGNGGDGVRSKSSASLAGATVTGNVGDGVRADGSASVVDSTVDGNGGSGMDSDKSAKAKRSSVSNNGFDGVRGLKASLTDATATGNGTAPACGVTDECADVASEKKPAVRGTSTCGTSRNTDIGGTWGVCSAD